MNRLRNYIINNLYITFLSIFTSLFAIASIFILIKLATYTAVIQLSIVDLLKLYLFIVPEIIFYILPSTFIVAAALSLFKLSTDNEMIVVFSLGIKPRFILTTLLKPASILTILLIFDFFVLLPYTKNLTENYISYKKTEAKFNLGASEFGHKFGKWLLYIGANNQDNTYSKVILFNKSEREELIISANTAEIINDNGILRLKLSNGKGYSYSKEKFSEIDFKTMFINDTMQTDLIPYEGILNYWIPRHKPDETALKTLMIDFDRKTQKAKFSAKLLLSFFPIYSIFLIASIGIVNVRHQKAMIYLFLFLAIVIYYGVTLGLKSKLGIYLIPAVSIGWLSVTYYIYKRKILKRF